MFQLRVWTQFHLTMAPTVRSLNTVILFIHVHDDISYMLSATYH